MSDKVTSFIPDAIREAANTIAAAIQGGGGTSVEWSQIITTGTKIAVITINGETTEVYAPAGGGGGSTVSWNEIQTTGTKIAEITIDGTTYDVYAPNVSVSAADVSYDNTSSGMVADDVQEAIDELATACIDLNNDLGTLSGTVSGHTTDIGNLQTAVGSKASQSMIAPVETSTTASQSYAIGEQFILNGTLYTATAAITAGGTITIGGNCSASDTITKQIAKVKNGGSVSVTTDGIKTWKTLLNELFALLDTSKVTEKSYMKYQNYVYASTYIVNNDTYQFTNANIYNQKFLIQRMAPRSGNNSAADNYNGTTYTSLSNTAPASGYAIELFY